MDQRFRTRVGRRHPVLSLQRFSEPVQFNCWYPGDEPLCLLNLSFKCVFWHGAYRRLVYWTCCAVFFLFNDSHALLPAGVKNEAWKAVRRWPRTGTTTAESPPMPPTPLCEWLGARRKVRTGHSVCWGGRSAPQTSRCCVENDTWVTEDPFTFDVN